MSTTYNPSLLNVLAIDYDTNLLNAIHCLSNRLLFFRLTTCCTVSDAWEHLKKHNYDIILIETHMPNQKEEDTDAFVQYVTSLLNIPVIMMSLDDQPSSVLKSISNGACSYWSKPLDENLFKNMWQHVVRKGLSQTTHDELQVKSLNKRAREEEDPDVSKQPLAKKSRHHELEVKALIYQGREDVEADVSNQPRSKKSRMKWTLGINNAVPKKVLKIMDYPGLKLAHVASHLQKHRNYLKGGIKNSKLSGFDFHGQNNNEVQYSMIAEVAPASTEQDECDDKSHTEQDAQNNEGKNLMTEQDQCEDIFFEWADFFPDLEDQDKILPEQDCTQIEESDIFSDLPNLFSVDDLSDIS